MKVEGNPIPYVHAVSVENADFFDEVYCVRVFDTVLKKYCYVVIET
jgi:hypothetical protein